MRKHHSTINNFQIIAIHEQEKLKGFFIADKNGEKLSSRTFDKASEAIDEAHILQKKIGLLND